MTTTELIYLILTAGLGILAIVLLGLAIWAAVAGAIVLIQPASNQGFLGFAAYVAMWVFLFPVMLLICIAVGGIRILAGTRLKWESLPE